MQHTARSQPSRVTAPNRKLTLRWAVVVMILAAVVLATVGGHILLRPSALIDSTAVSGADFNVYLPTKQPAEYSLVDDSVKFDGEVFNYAFENQQSGQQITVTSQAKPASFDMGKMSEGGSIISTSTANGTLYNLSAGESSQYMLDTGDGLVFFRSNVNLATATVVTLADTLRSTN